MCIRDRHYVVYEEIVEGHKDTVKNTIKIRPAGVDIIKNGVAAAHMVFEKNKKNVTLYQTPAEMCIRDRSCSAFEAAQTAMNAADKGIQIGSLSNLEYLEKQSEYLTAKSEKTAAELDYFWAMETYDLSLIHI